MSTNLVLLCYLLALLAAVGALYWCGRAKWYWHLLSFLAAMAIGLLPPPEAWAGPVYDLGTGCAFVFLLVWGIGEPIYEFFKLPHYESKRRAS